MDNNNTKDIITQALRNDVDYLMELKKYIDITDSKINQLNLKKEKININDLKNKIQALKIEK